MLTPSLLASPKQGGTVSRDPVLRFANCASLKDVRKRLEYETRRRRHMAPAEGSVNPRSKSRGRVLTSVRR
jgi:hypothetical protein